MDYDKLNSSSQTRRKRQLILIAFFATLLIAASVVSITVLVRFRSTKSSLTRPEPTQAISQACGLTLYPDLCINSLLEFPGALEAGERELVHISLNMTLQHVDRALYDASAIVGVSMDTRARAAYEDCMELLDDSIDQLTQSLSTIAPDRSGDRARGASDDDVLTWLSAALTNHDTCFDGLDEVANEYVKEQMEDHLKDLTELVSNSLAIFSTSSKNQAFTGIPIQNKKRKLLSISNSAANNFPNWVKKSDRRLLDIPTSEIQADIVVSKYGNGTYKTIADAVKAAPEKSSRRIIIYIKAGRYDENVKVSRKKTNLMFIGDGKGKTVISGYRSVADGYTTFRTATFASTGAGFIMRDMSIENRAGPQKHQAVALRVGADRAVVYRCDITGYQDTLYVHSQRQFFRECDVYGTVDFIFGNAAVVLQNCNLWSRKPMAMQC